MIAPQASTAAQADERCLLASLLQKDGFTQRHSGMKLEIPDIAYYVAYSMTYYITYCIVISYLIHFACRDFHDTAQIQKCTKCTEADPIRIIGQPLCPRKGLSLSRL